MILWEELFELILQRHFFSDTTFEAWSQLISDENDNVKTSRFYYELIKQGIVPNNNSWTSTRIEAEKEAMIQTESHADTPKIVHLDNLGRVFLEENSLDTLNASEKLFTHSEIDISGNKLSITDPRQYSKNKNRTSDHIIKNFQYFYDMQNRQLVSISVDAGTIKVLQNALNNPIYTQNARRFTTNIKYDKLQRPLQIHVEGDNLDNIVEIIEYGDPDSDPTANKDKNLRGKIIRHFDQAGIKEFLLYDIMGQNVLSRTRLRQEYK
jgi:hypothetical protein